ncbi:unnamed protein product, partial [Gongylonema pulchrum]
MVEISIFKDDVKKTPKIKTSTASSEQKRTASKLGSDEQMEKLAKKLRKEQKEKQEKLPEESREVKKKGGKQRAESRESETNSGEVKRGKKVVEPEKSDMQTSDSESISQMDWSVKEEPVVDDVETSCNGDFPAVQIKCWFQSPKKPDQKMDETGSSFLSMERKTELSSATVPSESSEVIETSEEISNRSVVSASIKTELESLAEECETAKEPEEAEMKDDSRTEARSSPQSMCSAASARPQSPPAAGTNHDKPQSPDGEASSGPQSPRIVEEGETPQSTDIGACHEMDQHETPKSPELNPDHQPQAIAEVSARKEAHEDAQLENSQQQQQLQQQHVSITNIDNDGLEELGTTTVVVASGRRNSVSSTTSSCTSGSTQTSSSSSSSSSSTSSSSASSSSANLETQPEDNAEKKPKQHIQLQVQQDSGSELTRTNEVAKMPDLVEQAKTDKELKIGNGTNAVRVQNRLPAIEKINFVASSDAECSAVSMVHRSNFTSANQEQQQQQQQDSGNLVERDADVLEAVNDAESTGSFELIDEGRVGDNDSLLDQDCVAAADDDILQEQGQQNHNQESVDDAENEEREQQQQQQQQQQQNADETECPADVQQPDAHDLQETEFAVQSISLLDDNRSQQSGEDGSSIAMDYLSEAGECSSSRRSSLAETALSSLNINVTASGQEDAPDAIV